MYYIVYTVYIVVVSLLCPVILDLFVLFIWNFVQVLLSCISSRLSSLVSLSCVVFKLLLF